MTTTPAQTTTKVLGYPEVVRARHSVRHYDPSVKISREELTEMLEEAVLAPSSSNLQPWRFLIIDDAELKTKLLPIAFNQQQVVDAAAVIAVLADRDAYLQVESIYEPAVASGFMTEERKQMFVESTLKVYSQAGEAKRRDIGLVDGGLVSMQFMLTAKSRGYDTVAMGGYNPEQLREAYNIPENLVTVMLIAVGKASQPAHPTPRQPIESVIFWNQLS